jgi:sugar phosphate isomerase/epimerase
MSSPTPNTQHPTPNIALQLYTVREATAADFTATLRQLAAIGYRAVELAGYGSSTPAEIRATLDELGMQAVSAHVKLELLDEQPEQTLADLKTLGCQYAVVPWVSEAHRSSAEQIGQLAATLNRFGALCKEAGLGFGYHNHAFEFAPVDGTTMWDILVEQTDPALVLLELDIFWAQYAGVDPAGLLKQLGARMPLLHIKDMAHDESRADVPVGTGRMPWAELLPLAAANGAQWYIVEQDHPRDPLPDVATSFTNLSRLLA